MLVPLSVSVQGLVCEDSVGLDLGVLYIRVPRGPRLLLVSVVYRFLEANQE